MLENTTDISRVIKYNKINNNLYTVRLELQQGKYKDYNYALES